MKSAALLLTVLCQPWPVAATVTEVHYVMGTYFRITAEGVDQESARARVRQCFTTARELDTRFSRFAAHGELSRLNANAADGAPANVSPEMAALLQAALRLQAATGGTFDVGAGVLTRLWRTVSAWPSRDSIAAARRADGGQAFDVVGTTLTRRAGTVIDLDGIAKGWAVDRCVAQLRAAGIGRAFLSFGESSLYALGAPAGQAGWKVWVRGLDSEQALGSVTLKDQAVSVSSVFGHERHVGPRRIGHIIDPRSGLPLTSPAAAVVIADSATTAEAFSKALLVDWRRGAAARKGLMTGALLVRRSGIKRFGRVAFTPFGDARPIAAAAEPLR